MSILISIIIPVFNVERYLATCLDSIVQQNAIDIEVILANDGSNDNSGYIANRYTQQYDFIKVIQQSNQGVSAARNRAIQEATGKYLVFLDSDDVLYKSFFQKILDLIKIQPDIIEINADLIDEEGTLLYKKVFLLGNTKTSLNNTDIAKLRLHKQAKYYLCSRIIRRELVEDLRFNERIGFCEDALYLTECYFRAAKIITVDQSLYGYRQHATNVTKVDASGNIDQLTDLAKIIKHKTIASTDTSYKSYYLSLLVNMVHLRKSMYAIENRRLACDDISLNNINFIKMFSQEACFDKGNSVSWIRQFSILAPKASNLLILVRIFLKKS